jgi:hypothetical protein
LTCPLAARALAQISTWLRASPLAQLAALLPLRRQLPRAQQSALARS